MKIDPESLGKHADNATRRLESTLERKRSLPPEASRETRSVATRIILALTILYAGSFVAAAIVRNTLPIVAVAIVSFIILLLVFVLERIASRMYRGVAP